MLKPIGDRVIIDVVQEEEVTAGGLVLTSASKEKPQVGTVIAVGAGRILSTGEILPLTVQPGDQVFFEKYAGTEIAHDGKEFLIVHEKDIIAIVE